MLFEEDRVVEKKEVKKDSKMSLFDYFGEITTGKTNLSDEQLKGYSAYMINRLVSMSDIYLPLSNEINKYQIPADIHYEFWKSVLPKRKMYNKYIKSKTIKEDDLLLVARYYEVGKKEAELYMSQLSTEQIASIVDLYKTR